jgi:hypothetical protein
LLSGCSGSGGAAAAGGSGANGGSNGAPITGVATPSNVSVVTTTN